MEQHVKVLAAFHIVFGALGLIAALGILIVFGGAAGAAGFAAADEPDAWIAVPILSIVGSLLMLIALTLSIPGIVAAWGLLQYKSWARLLMIVLSFLHLINFPFGTLLAIYGLWVLLTRETEILFGVRPPATTEAGGTGA